MFRHSLTDGLWLNLFLLRQLRGWTEASFWWLHERLCSAAPLAGPFATAALIDSLSRGVIESHLVHRMEVNGSLVAPLVFKTSVGLNKVPGGFDSHPPPPVFKG